MSTGGSRGGNQQAGTGPLRPDGRDQRADAAEVSPRGERVEQLPGDDLRLLHLFHVDDRARARHDHRLVEGPDLEHGALVQQHLFGEGRQIDELMDRMSALRKSRRLAGSTLTVRAVGA